MIQFLRANPDEELTRGDVAVKFDALGTTIDTALVPAVEHKMLVKGKNGEAELVWRIGPKTKPALVTADGEPVRKISRPAIVETSNLTWRGPAAPKQTNRAEFIDTLSVVLDDDVPVLRGGGKGEDWLPLLARMKPTQSFVLPIAKKSTMLKAIAQAHREKAGRWTSRVLASTEQFRVWRLE